MDSKSFQPPEPPPEDEPQPSPLSPLQLLLGIPLTILTLSFTCYTFYLGISNHTHHETKKKNSTSLSSKPQEAPLKVRADTSDSASKLK